MESKPTESETGAQGSQRDIFLRNAPTMPKTLRDEKFALPNFIVIGAAKCGTTSLCDHLRAHPDIFFSTPKEPYFFCDIEGYRDPDKWKWYSSLFDGSDTYDAIGEGSTAYTHPDVAELTAKRISAVLPDCKIIFAVRHPLRRIESDWRMRVREGWAPNSLDRAIDANQSLVTHSMYWKNLSPYLARFDSSKILIVFLEDMKSDPKTQIKRLYDFLGVDSSFLPSNTTIAKNSSEAYRKDGAISKWARSSSLITSIYRRLPHALRSSVKASFTTPYDLDAFWTDEVKRRVVAELAADTISLLKYARKPDDFWNLDQ